jgi:hypothetical protein
MAHSTVYCRKTCTASLQKQRACELHNYSLQTLHKTPPYRPLLSCCMSSKAPGSPSGPLASSGTQANTRYRCVQCCQLPSLALSAKCTKVNRLVHDTQDAVGPLERTWDPEFVLIDPIMYSCSQWYMHGSTSGRLGFNAFQPNPPVTAAAPCPPAVTSGSPPVRSSPC